MIELDIENIKFIYHIDTMENETARLGWKERMLAVVSEADTKEEENNCIEVDPNSGEAIVSFNITQNDTGEFECVEIGDSSEVIKQFSLLKYGDNEAAEFFVDRMERDFINRMESDVDFFAIFTSAAEEGRHIFLTGPGTRNVPSASDNLLRKFADRINIYLTNKGLPTFIKRGMTRFGTSNPNYAQMSHEDRIVAKKNSPRSFVPREIQGQDVFYIDDIFITGSVVHGAKQRMMEVDPNSMHFLLGARVDPDIVRKDARVEHELNSAYIDGTINEHILRILNDPDIFIVQKLLRLILSPQNIKKVVNLAKSGAVPTENLRKIFEAAMGNDFLYQQDGIYEKPLRLLESFLYPLDNTENSYCLPTLLKINSKESIPSDFAVHYSQMKYGCPESVRFFAEKLAESLLGNKALMAEIKETGKLIITSSAFGEVQTAANALATDVIDILSESGINVDTIKIDRYGDFSTSNYGTMTESERLKRMSARRISISDENRAKIKAGTVVVIDDVKVTGSHEKTLHEVLDGAGCKNFHFAYLANFDVAFAKRNPEVEEFLNRNKVGRLMDIAPFFVNRSPEEIRINARSIKFIMKIEPDVGDDISKLEKQEELQTFCEILSDDVLQIVYEAASSKDGYKDCDTYKEGFLIIQRELLSRNLISIDEINHEEKKQVSFNITLDGGSYTAMESGKNMEEIIQRYSLMKFGSVEDIKFFAQKMASQFIDRVRNDINFRQHLEQIGQNDEFIYAMAPGSRNVESSSNFILEEAVEIINVFLSRERLPTIILKNLTRLGSKTANYAELSAEERSKGGAKTSTIMPKSELQEFPIHVLFADDVEITGTTYEKARRKSIESGALSVQSLFAIRIDPNVVNKMPEIENKINTEVIKGRLDDSIKNILNQDGFRPVQRLMRVILHPDNRHELKGFIEQCDVSSKALLQLYRSAMANDYLWIKQESEHSKGYGVYGDSIDILERELKSRNLIKSW